MKISHINFYKGGWFIGDFIPSVLKTDKFEVAYMRHKKGEKWDKHYHKYATEYNCVVRGKIAFRMGSMGDYVRVIRQGYVFTIEPGEIVEPEFLEDTEIIVVKVPSIPGDKHVVE